MISRFYFSSSGNWDNNNASSVKNNYFIMICSLLYHVPLLSNSAIIIYGTVFKIIVDPVKP